MTFSIAALYLLFLLGLGYWSYKRTRDARDYFLAGSRLGLIPAVFATMASIMSGFVFIGGPGLFQQVGLGSFWITISSSFTGAMMCWLLARPLRRMAAEEDCLTIPDVIRKRYGCRLSGGLAAGAILVGVLGYLATQLQALGVILASMLPISLKAALLIGVGVLVFYSVAGGMIAGVYSDLVQGAIMVWAATLVFVFALESGGGLSGISRTLLESDPEMLSPWGTVGAVGALSWFYLFAVGSMGQPHVVHKFMMVRDLRVLRWFPLVLAVSMILCGLIWMGGGLAVRSLVLTGGMDPPDDPDEALPRFLLEFTPPWLSALALAGVLAAVMSTADSFANVGAAALARDLPRALGRDLKDEVRWGRIFSLLLFGGAFLFAEAMGERVAYLGIFGFGSFAAALTPVLVLGLNWSQPGRWAARIGLLTGLGLNLFLELLQRLELYPLQAAPASLALTASFLVFLCAGRFWRHPG